MRRDGLRDSDHYKTQIENFRNKLENQTMPFWTKTAMSSFSGPNAEADKKILESMMSYRVASYGSKDVKLRKQMVRKENKQTCHSELQEHENIATSSRFETAQLADSSDEENIVVPNTASAPTSDGASTSASSESTRRKRKRSDDAVLTLPAK